MTTLTVASDFRSASFSSRSSTFKPTYAIHSTWWHSWISFIIYSRVAYNRRKTIAINSSQFGGAFERRCASELQLTPMDSIHILRWINNKQNCNFRANCATKFLFILRNITANCAHSHHLRNVWIGVRFPMNSPHFDTFSVKNEYFFDANWSCSNVCAPFVTIQVQFLRPLARFWANLKQQMCGVPNLQW